MLDSGAAWGERGPLPPRASLPRRSHVLPPAACPEAAEVGDGVSGPTEVFFTLSLRLSRVY